MNFAAVVACAVLLLSLIVTLIAVTTPGWIVGEDLVGVRYAGSLFTFYINNIAYSYAYIHEMAKRQKIPDTTGNSLSQLNFCNSTKSHLFMDLKILILQRFSRFSYKDGRYLRVMVLSHFWLR